jgi:hypothetical protein
MNRGCLWRLRDELYDARLEGHLPEVDCVGRLLDRIEMFIVIAPRISAFQLWWLRKRFSIQRTDDVLLKAEEMDREQAFAFTAFQLRLVRIVTRQYLTGSWSGLLLAGSRNQRLLVSTLSTHSMPETSEFSRGRDSFSTAHEAELLREMDAERSIARRVEDALSHLRVSRDDNDLVGAAG